MYKVLLSLSLLLFIASSARGQSFVAVDASQYYSTFSFVDSKGNADKDYAGIYSGGYSIGFRRGGELGGVIFRGGLGMHSAGATLVYDGSNYKWDLKYFDVKAGVGYMLLGERIQPYLTANPYLSYLLKGNQVINNQNHDMLESASVQKIDYGVHLTPGVQLKLSDAFSCYVEANYIMGLRNLESAGEQKTFNRGYAITVGGLFSISSGNTK